MLAALPLAADVAATIALSDRTETRLRQPGDASTGPSLDVATAPEARMTLVLPRIGCALTYAPRLSFWDVNDVGLQPTWFHAGSVHLDWRTNETSLSLDQAASYGAMSFAGLTVAPGPEGTPPRVDVIPPSQIIHVESSSTTVGSRTVIRRWELRSAVGYQLSGGATDVARTILPLQRGPLADAALTYATSPVDHVATTVSGTKATFSSGPEIALVEADEGYKHRWSAVTETNLTFGVSQARVQASPLIGVTGETHPVAEATLDHGISTGVDRVTLHVGARLGPVVNRLLGVVDERVQGTVLSKWTHGPFVVNAFGSAQRSVPYEGPNATALLTGELGLSYTAVAAVVFDVGVRGVWQRANQALTSTSTPGGTDVVEASIAQGTVFVGVTFRAPIIRL
jgi:hypothetical protein